MKRCALILTHGRPDNQATISSLRRYGWTGEIVLLLDDEDDTIEQYRKNYPSCRIITFSKDKEMKRPFALVDNFSIRGTVLYARNAAWDIMRREGYDEFIMLDDDYATFQYKWIIGDQLMWHMIRSLDNVVDVWFKFLREADLDVACWAQGGDYIGGAESGSVKKWVCRKAMNVYFFRTDRPYMFTGAMNDDVNTYVLGNIRGKKIITVLNCMIVQCDTQQNGGGLTQMYLDFGTYNKSFYSVVVAPSCVRIATLGDPAHGRAYLRIHHSVKWANCSPKILSPKWKK